jgi:prepilin-type N-terminal cleavage/methylation domain-containing protein
MRMKELGFSLPEILAVVAIIGLLAAIGIPVSMNQQNRASEATIKSDVTSVAAAIETQLLSWRGVPPEALNICNNLNGNYPPGGDVVNTCAEGEWKTTRVRNGSIFPELSGKTSLETRIVGRIASDGSYCIDASSTRNKNKTFFYDSITTQINPGSCRTSDWKPKGGVSGSPVSEGLSNADTVPPPPAGVNAIVNNDGTVTAKWDAIPGTTYNIKITGYPAVTFIPEETQASCIFPTDNCENKPNGVLPGGLYTLTVRAGNNIGLSAGANTDFLVENKNFVEGNPEDSNNSTSSIPEPKSVVAQTNTGGILVSWQPPITNSSTEIIGYRIRWSTDNGNTWVGENIVMNNTTSYLVEDIESSKTYVFQVQAIGTAGVAGAFSSLSNQVFYSPNLPASPRNLTASSESEKVLLQWEPPIFSSNSPQIIDYDVSVQPTTGIVEVSGTKATITGLTNGTTYIFSVRARNLDGYSEPVTISETPKLASPPSRPTSLVAEPAENAVRLSWSAPLDSGNTLITDYIIEYSIGGNWTKVNDGVSTKTSYTVSGLNNNTKYFFKVAAVNSAGQSSFSDIVNATPQVIGSGGTETTKIFGDSKYRVHVYQYTGTVQTFNIAKTTEIEVLAVGAGGGGGGNEYNYGGGGASGAGVVGKIILEPGSYTVMVGGGGGGGSSCVTNRGGGLGGFNGGGKGGNAGSTGCSGGGGGGGGWSGLTKGNILYVVAGGGGGGGGANEGYANDIPAKGGGVQTNGVNKNTTDGGNGFDYGRGDGGGGGGGGGGYFGGLGQTCNGCSNSGGGVYVVGENSTIAQVDGNSGGHKNNGFGGNPVSLKESSWFGYNNKLGAGGNAEKNGMPGVVFIRYQIN